MNVFYIVFVQIKCSAIENVDVRIRNANATKGKWRTITLASTSPRSLLIEHLVFRKLKSSADTYILLPRCPSSYCRLRWRSMMMTSILTVVGREAEAFGNCRELVTLGFQCLDSVRENRIPIIQNEEIRPIIFPVTLGSRLTQWSCTSHGSRRVRCWGGYSPSCCRHPHSAGRSSQWNHPSRSPRESTIDCAAWKLHGRGRCNYHKADHPVSQQLT